MSPTLSSWLAEGQAGLDRSESIPSHDEARADDLGVQGGAVGSGLDRERLLALEWLETNGLGDYAAGTAEGCATRRYHGLLVAHPPALGKRHLFVSRFDERALTSAGPQTLGAAQYRGRFSEPATPLESFELVPWPRTTWRLADGSSLRREILMSRGSRTTLVRYSLQAPRAQSKAQSEARVELELRPLLACREADALTLENEDLDTRAETSADGLRVRPYDGLPAVAFGFGGASVETHADSLWYRGLSYPADLQRGYPGLEDHWSPALLKTSLAPDDALVIGIALEDIPGDPRTLFEQEARRRLRELADLSRGHGTRRALDGGDSEPPVEAPVEWTLESRLELGAEAFLSEAAGGRLGVTAGYPWFEQWGRDTFIALPGLTLARGRLDDCERALLGTLDFLTDGLLPNIYRTGCDDSDYGSADAALWFARACLLYDRAAARGARRGASRRRALGELRPALESIANEYLDGQASERRLGLFVDESGLLHAGSAERNPTWMDACVDGVPVTPRDGAAVELNALWYSLLTHLQELAKEQRDRDSVRRWRAERRRCGHAFLSSFWLAGKGGDVRRGYLADVWKDGLPDRSVRPNMVLAASLELSPLGRAHRRAVCRRARRELLTPRGLRSLSPRDPRYVGRYAGGPQQRDAAYHQGSVWPWLFGAYVEARLRTAGPRPKRSSVRKLLRRWQAFGRELERAGLGHISEVFDGDEPQTPGGSIAQAWNTAELLRCRALLREAGA